MEYVTLYDIAARLGNNGDKAMQKVVELQAKTNDILQVLPLKECNNGTKETVLVRKALPEIAWRMLNQGTTPSKSASGQVNFTTGGMEALAEIDERMMKLNKNSNTWRLSENIAHQEAMTQKLCQTLFYGDEKLNPAGFTGFGAYYYSKSLDPLYSDQIIDAGGTGDNLTSIWFVTFGMDTVYGIHPEGVPGGYQYRDNGRQQNIDSNGGKYYVYQSQYNWDIGLAIRDPRYVVRIANVDATGKTTDTELIRNLIKGFNQLHNPDHGRTACLCNRAVQTRLAELASEKSNVNLRYDEFAGKKVTHFWGAPVLRNDAILNTESQVV